MTADDVVDQVKAQVSDARTRLAMLLGSQLEGGWGPTFNVGDQGTSFGPFQIHLPAHPDITAAEAADPQSAVRYMKAAYAGAVAQVPDALWQSDPETAAEHAAFIAERPAQDYYLTEGASAIDAAYGKASKAASGGGGHWYDAINRDLNPVNIVKGAAGGASHVAGDVAGQTAQAVAAGFGAALTSGPVKELVLTVAFAGLGLALITLGGYQLSKPALRKAAPVVKDATIAAAAAA